MVNRFEDFWAEMTGARHHAFHMKVWAALGNSGERAENFRRLMAGKIHLVMEDVDRTPFGRRGRRIPPPGLESPVMDADHSFGLEQPAVDYALRLFRLHMALGLTVPFIQPAEFERRATEIERWLADNNLLANLLRGPHYPIVFPRTEIRDYGTALEEVFLPAAGRAFEAEFSGRNFCNYEHGRLASKVTVASSSRHEVLLAALAAGPVVALYFPTALQGFSTRAELEQLATLPEEILLAGALEPAVALAMYPDVLARDDATPQLDCSALQDQVSSFAFYKINLRLGFSCVGLGASGGSSGGLVVLG